MLSRGKKISTQEAVETIRFAADEAKAEHIYLMSVYRAVLNPPEGHQYDFYTDEAGNIVPLLVKRKGHEQRTS